MPIQKNNKRQPAAERVIYWLMPLVAFLLLLPVLIYHL
ncbi:Sugar ABC transporter permease [Nosocomiicoccus ampullae]|uniref:Uncharacterized protein n=1 Tax=Nosocomiicoccus ampullae TaxID=489910 RepID=A0A9Q2CXU8_9STAP|nr:hypothetical protein [Nosocomiicoccus ampullae]